MKRSIFSTIASIAAMLALSMCAVMCAVSPAQAATPGVYSFPDQGAVYDLANVRSVTAYNANFVTINYVDGTSATVADTGQTVFTRLKADPHFAVFDSGNTAINMNNVKKIICSANWATVTFITGNITYPNDPGCATYAALQAASN